MISKHVIIACLLLATTIVLSKAQLTFENDPSTVDGRPTVILDAKEYMTERSRQSMGSHLFSSHHTINNNNDDAAVDHHTSFDQRKRADARLDNNNVENESSAAAYNPNARTFFHKHNDKDGKKGNKYYNTVNYYYTNDDYGHGGYGHENYGHEEYGGYGHEAYDHGQYKHEVYDREGYGHGGYEHEGSDYGYKGYGHEGGYDHAYGGHNSFRNSDAHSKSIVGKYNSNQSHTPLKGHYKSSHGSAGYHHGSSSHQGTSSHSGGHKVPTHYNNHH